MWLNEEMERLASSWRIVSNSWAIKRKCQSGVFGEVQLCAAGMLKHRPEGDEYSKGTVGGREIYYSQQAEL